MLLKKLRTEVIPKLKLEWKTAAIAVTGTVTELALAVEPTALENVIHDKYKPIVHVSWPVLMLLFRRWRDTNVRSTTINK